ncbi:YbaK/EbsC family protein [Pelagibius litoralis]|uniref:YbaK/EbsC family protein n=1 Tax=Pelagibius litoralis TaxID=374515 RepID=A0A967F2Q8_9PROT|nr:YbaK/EbsC family protein [Pelagibius litoralis]NIA71927.1 YbaK/EbsC family protein [Pelagibius litoralis]
MADEPLKASARRVQQAIEAAGFDFQVCEFPASTRSAEDAAVAIGCTVAQIAKSLIFRARESGAPVLVLASGANRVDEAALGALLGEPVGRAKPDFVREATGFAIGGVAPVGHTRPPTTFIDRDLMDLAEIWAAAGTPNAVFCLTPAQLCSITGGRVADIRQA